MLFFRRGVEEATRGNKCGEDKGRAGEGEGEEARPRTENERGSKIQVGDGESEGNIMCVISFSKCCSLGDSYIPLCLSLGVSLGLSVFCVECGMSPCPYRKVYKGIEGVMHYTSNNQHLEAA